ncbi:MAG: NTP transferase domain-containing protein [Rhodospirillaceae bacterium]|nr:NTP transferase domain-containing protein [Rhodospirillaceae bacterium]
MPAADGDPKRAVQALIQAAGSGSRLGQGPKAFVALGERTLLERSIALFRDIADHVIVAVPTTELARARALLAGSQVDVIPGGESRSQTTRRLIEASSSPWLLLHDVVHPFASPALVRRVLDAAITHGASAPAVSNAEFLYDTDGNPLHAPGAVLIGQKPVGLSREKLQAAYRVSPALPGDPSVLEVLAAAGTPTRFVPGDRQNIKITEPDDLALARALIALET